MRQGLSAYEDESERVKDAFAAIEQELFEKAEECDAKKLDIDEKEADIAHANGQIDELTQRTYLLEDELDTLRGESAAAGREAAERIEQLEVRLNAYKAVCVAFSLNCFCFCLHSI